MTVKVGGGSTTSRSSTNLDHPSKPSRRQPAKQYAHPFSCDRATASTPDGTTCTPGSNAATHSAFTAAASILIFCATMPLYTVSATLQQPTCAPLASKAAVPVPGSGIGSCFPKILPTAN